MPHGAEVRKTLNPYGSFPHCRERVSLSQIGVNCGGGLHAAGDMAHHPEL